ncbi:MAG TPA: glycoside hydrolase family 2 TIM barrel-domain containing protein [Opitutaceae bacterium]
MSRIPIPARFRSMAATVVILGSCIGMGTTAHAASARERSLFDFGWRFQLGDIPGGESQNFDDSAWRPLDLPHDWSIEGPYDEKAPAGGTGGYLPTGIGWYRKAFTVPEADRGRSVLVEFDGVYERSTVWVNGKELGTRPYGYSSFHYDLTPYLNYGGTRNVIAVRVDNSLQPNSRWYSGSGIYRHTWLLTAAPVHIAPWGVLVRTPEVSAASATVTVTTRLQNARSADARVEVRTLLLEAQPSLPPGVAPPSSSSAAVVTAEGEGEISATLVLPAPRLWSPDSPTLYTVRTEVLVAGEVVDSVDTVFGIRSVTFDVDRGLLINEVPVKMKGMCIHHDAGALGAAVPDAVLERRLRLLQEMGCNAIRCSHNPMAPEFYDLCDRLGIMVMDESFDEWTLRKPQLKSGYSDVFADWYARDVGDLIRRDRNHPSVMLWNAGNEIGEQTDPTGPAVLAKLIEIFHREDPTRPVTVAMDNVFNQSGPAATAFTDKLDIVGYNYVDRWGARRETQYSDDRTAYRNRRFIGTEETGVASTRGLYAFGSLLGDNDSDDVLILGHGPEGALYLAASIRAAALWRFAATRDYVIGEFTWTGFDYLGESKWPRKLTAFGALDTCGFKKDSFYFYQSIWTKAPMIHLLPHWNWPGREGSVVPVVAYTNCAAVELFLNGKSLGVKAHEFPSEGVTGAWNNFAEPKTEATTADLQLAWDVAYAPGELKAVGYDSRGNIVANASVRTAGKAARLEISADKAALKSGSRDVASVTVRALDADGNFVPLADNQVTFEISGPAKIIGVDNGDPVSHASYQGLTRALFNGMALAIAQSGDEPGGIHITARADGLQQAQLDLSSVRPL